MKSYLYFVTFVAALGSLLFGFETGVINGAISDVAAYFSLTPAMEGFAVSIALIGCVIGALFVGKPADLYGRRYILRYMALFFLLSMLMTGLAPKEGLWIFILGRFIGGLAVGGASVVTPMYISEIAPPKYRGRLVATAQLAIVLGILVSFFSNYIIDSVGGEGEWKWRWMFLFGVVPSIVFFILLFFIQRSPRWLVKKGMLAEARASLVRANDEDPDILIKEIQDSLDKEVSSNFSTLLRKPYFKLVLIGIGVGMFNQLSGINIVNYYSTEIFKSAGLDRQTSFYLTVLVGITNLIFTIVGMSLIDKFGRKTLLYIGGIGMPLFLGLFAWADITQQHSIPLILGSLLGFIALFAVSQGTVIWVMLSEMFPTDIRAMGSAIGSFSHWFFNAIVSFLFPIALRSIGGGYAFLFFSIATLLSLIFYRYALIETKGKSLEEIERLVLGTKH
jgi:sugar porter (SP) family MFS transporter